MSNDQLGDRMKMYERTGASMERMMPGLPVIARLDGKAFHSFTKGLDRPFDAAFNALMVECTKFLVQETNACIGYTQSDEITLIWYTETIGSQLWFDARRDKLNSVLASLCSVYFNEHMPNHLPEKYTFMSFEMDRPNFPVFDCRVWCVPTKMEACNVLVWREQDATRNSIQMAGQSEFSHKELMNLSCNKIQEKLWQEKNINWDNYPSAFKRGSYIQRRTYNRKFGTIELERLPAAHAARTNPELMFERRHFESINMPIFSTITNRQEVVFDGVGPETNNE